MCCKLQEKFSEKVGYVKFVDALKGLGQPYQELVRTLVDMVSLDFFPIGSEWEKQQGYDLQLGPLIYPSSKIC